MSNSQEDLFDVDSINVERADVFRSLHKQDYPKLYKGVPTSYEVGSVMKDKNKRGKDNRWDLRKAQGTEIGDIMLALNVPANKTQKFGMCAEVLLFAISSDDQKKLRNAWFCKDKLCPVCQWRRSLKMGFYNRQIIKQIAFDDVKGKYIFLTLTVKNCKGEDLKSTIQMILKGFDRMFRRAVFKKHVLGFIRSLEVTYNEQTREFHPHLHVLMLMDESYWSFKKTNGKRKLEPYLNHSDFVDMWQQSCKLDYRPSVDVRAVKRRKGKGDTLEKVVLEVSKYAFKPIDIKNLDDYDKRYVISSLIVGLNRVRQVGYGGIFKEILNKMNADEENLTLISNADDDDFVAKKFAFSAYSYKRKKYFWMNKKD
ncbi:TPA: protein rep [Streptococcus suis]